MLPSSKHGVVVAAVLVVDDPQPLAVVDEVGRQQVVVAGDGGLPAYGEGVGDALDLRHQVEVALRQPEAALLRRSRGSAAGSRTCRSRPRSARPRAAPGRPLPPGRASRRPAGRSRRACGPRPTRRPVRGARAGTRPPPVPHRSPLPAASCCARHRGRWPAGRRPSWTAARRPSGPAVVTLKLKLVRPPSSGATVCGSPTMSARSASAVCNRSRTPADGAGEISSPEPVTGANLLGSRSNGLDRKGRDN